MIKIEQAVIVEGKYDKLRLKQCIDAVIIETGGFRICKDRQKLELIKSIAKNKGIIVMTDSDSAGFFIRNYLRCAVEVGRVRHVYIPEIYGKEKRKAKASKEGKLGLEGLDNDTIIRSLQRAKVIDNDRKTGGEKISRLDLFEDGLSGRKNSAAMRRNLLNELDFPRYLSTTAIIEILNAIMSKEEYKKLVAKVADCSRDNNI